MYSPFNDIFKSSGHSNIEKCQIMIKKVYNDNMRNQNEAFLMMRTKNRLPSYRKDIARFDLTEKIISPELRIHRWWRGEDQPRHEITRIISKQGNAKLGDGMIQSLVINNIKLF